MGHFFLVFPWSSSPKVSNFWRKREQKNAPITMAMKKVFGCNFRQVPSFKNNKNNNETVCISFSFNLTIFIANLRRFLQIKSRIELSPF